eukprot:g82010.t1
MQKTRVGMLIVVGLSIVALSHALSGCSLDLGRLQKNTLAKSAGARQEGGLIQGTTHAGRVILLQDTTQQERRRDNAEHKREGNNKVGDTEPMQKTRVGTLWGYRSWLSRGISLLTRKSGTGEENKQKESREETAGKQNSVVHNAATRKRNIADWLLLVLVDVEAWHTVAEGVSRQETSMHRGNTIKKGSYTSWELSGCSLDLGGLQKNNTCQERRRETRRRAQPRNDTCGYGAAKRKTM